MIINMKMEYKIDYKYTKINSKSFDKYLGKKEISNKIVFFKNVDKFVNLFLYLNNLVTCIKLSQTYV